MKFQCLLFDLDGTLIDSRADLILSINLMLAELECATLPDVQIITFVGEGIRLLVERALRASRAKEYEEELIEAALISFRRHYSEHLLDQTDLYPEVRETLEALQTLPMAVVTNKPYDFTIKILEGLQLTHFFQAVIGGDSLLERKPSALPLLEAAKLCGVAPERCLMIGDTKVDILAGQAAGMSTCGFTGGFRGEQELAAVNAEFLIGGVGELIQIVKMGE
jgi:phosphoglycolate phosphatase